MCQKYFNPVGLSFSIDSCSVKCLNGGTCLNSTCNCSDGYTGKDCEYECKFNDVRITHDSHARCPRNVTLLQEEDNRTIEFIMETTRITTDTIIQINDSSMFKISVNCQFRNIYISWKEDVFTFGTVHLFDNTIWLKTVGKYAQKGTMYHAQFSSGVNTEWTLFENGKSC
ncbi:unnamed protein product [Mytilus edulis]|uniref:EGF-like domain-containing protein n=1 Tax=Mytilus edulis TaxID=6550 RepID=A0A8S3SQ47_MYTED|nr:unnamed protein product [Mytilus edulis]